MSRRNLFKGLAALYRDKAEAEGVRVSEHFHPCDWCGLEECPDDMDDPEVQGRED
jgi:hypothetical protein